MDSSLETSPSFPANAPGAIPVPAVRLRQLLVWCFPALLLAIYLRASLTMAIPEAYFGADSPSYFHATDRLWDEGHRFIVRKKRRWVYPVLCLPLPALPWSPAQTLPILQHVLGLGIIVGVGWIVAHLTRFRALWVPLATLVVAGDLALLRNEHEIIGDSVFLAALVGTVALAMPPGSLRDRPRLFWFLLMAAVVMAIKPHGRGIWLGAILAAMLVTRPWKWKVEAWGAVAVGFAVILTSGQDRQAAWLFLDAALPFVNLDGEKWTTYREALRPTVLRARQDYEKGQYPWTRHAYEKALGDGNPKLVDPVWAELASRKDDTEYIRVCTGLAREALERHPWEFLGLTVMKIGVVLAQSDSPNRFDPAGFWPSEAQDAAEYWANTPHQMSLYYRMNQPEFEALVAQRQGRVNGAMPVIRFLHDIQDGNGFFWMRQWRDPATGQYGLTPGVVAILAGVGLFFCLRPTCFAAAAAVWLPAILLMGTVFALADCVPNYIEPVRWAWVTLAVVGLDGVIAAALTSRQPSARVETRVSNDLKQPT